MKKIIQTIRLHKLKTEVNAKVLEKMNENEYFILFKDGTYKSVYIKDDLIKALCKDHVKPISYIFNMSDRIIIDRDVHINEE